MRKSVKEIEDVLQSHGYSIDTIILNVMKTFKLKTLCCKVGFQKAAKQRFGASSERTPNSDEQLYLFEEKPEFQSEEEKAPTQAVKAHTRLKRKSGDKARLIADIPREVVECVLNPEEACDVCSSPLQVIGKKTVRTELEFIPAKLKVLEYVGVFLSRII